MMVSKLMCVKLLFLMFVFLENYCNSEGCWEEERLALLKIKHFFNGPTTLTNWVDGDDNSDCCQWESVECNNITGRVKELDLGISRNWDLGEWYLNASLFTPFKELEVLYLYGNHIAGCVENEGLRKLKTLDLSNNILDRSSLSFINGLSSLRNLYLSAVRFNGTFDVGELNSLSNLEKLYLSGNMIDKFVISKELGSLSNLKVLDLRMNKIDKFVIPKGLKRLTSLDLSDNQLREINQENGLNKLETLNLSDNILDRSILSFINGLSSLRNLYLRRVGFNGTFDVGELGFLSYLKVLDLSFNMIDKFVIPKGLEGLTSLDLSYNQLREINHVNGLRKLKTLDLSNNILDRSSLSFINGLSSLRNLYLSAVGFNGTFDVGELGSLSYLKVLDLNFNMIDKFVIPKELNSLSNLEKLDLNSNMIDKFVILKGLERLTSLELSYNQLREINQVNESDSLSNLKVLDLRGNMIEKFVISKDYKSWKKLNTLHLEHNNLTRALFSQGLCELVHLETLYINNNDIGGSLPWCLANMTSLQILDVSCNQLTGNISSSPLIPLTSIQKLTLSSNHFQIPISLEPFFNHSNLKMFDGADNQYFYTEVESHSLAPKFQLNSIKLSSHLNGGTFPKFLYHQQDLQEVDLSDLNLTGGFPNWLLENNTNLWKLTLVNNSLAGPIQLPSNSNWQLRHLNISGNAFNGSIPSSFSNMNSLEILDLSNNQLTGGIPEHLAMGCFSLQLLVLSNNNLQGRIFSKSFNLINLVGLKLDDNHFVGEIPECLSNSSFLQGLYLRNNDFYGSIPRWLGNMSNLEDIVLSNNHLEGPIPAEFCQLNSLEILDISENNLSGNLPSCFSPIFIKQVHLSKNMLEGQLKDGTLYNSSSLVTLDLSYNFLNGSIPKWIDRLSNLSYLLLANNTLEGEVPFQLCKLNKLRLIDLSHNHLSGQIPHCLDNTSLNKGYYTPATPTPYKRLAFISRIPIAEEEIIMFTTKKISYSYRGRPLESMFGVDVSCNNLTGQIPPQIGNLTMIHALNLSHNSLTGSIPLSFSNLKQIESLDLSYNKLNGKIPSQLVELNALSVFSVEYNNLSGKIPEWTAQFATFNASSYEENPLLCGLPLPKNCSENGLPLSMPKASTGEEEDDNLIDKETFYISFVVSYVILLFGFIVVLYVNPYWRRKWFYLVELWMTSCWYFVVDNLNPQ